MEPRIVLARLMMLAALACGVVGLVIGIADRAWKLGITGWFTGGTLLAVLALVTGFVVFDQVGRAMGFPGGIGDIIFLGEPELFRFDIGVALGSTALVGLGIFGGWYAWAARPELPRLAAQRFRSTHALLVNKYYLDDFYQAIIDRGVMAGSRLLAWFDRNVVNDTGVDGSAGLGMFSGFGLKFLETGKLPNYALAIVTGVIILGIVFMVVRV